MPGYQGQADRRDRARALVAVALVHLALGAAILTGLNVRSVAHTIERLKTFDITEAPPPPPEPPPPPQPRQSRPEQEEGAAGKKAEPTPVVAPKPRVVVPATPPVVAAPIAGTGNSNRAGAALAGSGTGAGGSGTGRGGRGTGPDFSRYTPARLIENIRNSDYRAIVGGRMSAGSAMVSLNVEPSGRTNQCRVVRSSGDPEIDAALCPLITRRLRFDPARDDRGRPIAYSLQYVPRWTR